MSPAAPSATEAQEGSQFYADAIVDVSGDIDGDVYAAGQSVTISGNVTGDVIAAAQTITITGTVDGDVRLAAQTVTISGEVTHSGTIFAADINVAETGSFGDDLVGASSTFAIAGDVGRDVLVSVDSLTINGSVGGDLSYVSDSTAVIEDGAVAGSVERVESPQAPAVEVSPWAAIVGWLLGLLYALVAFSMVTLVAGLLIPRWLQRVTDHLVPSPWKAMLVGFVASLAIPIGLLALLVTVVGAPLVLAGLLVWAVLTLSTFVFASYYIGRLLLRGGQHPLAKSLIGGLILIVALQIPWLNILVWCVMVFIGLGAQLLTFRSARPWRYRSATDSEPSPLAPRMADEQPSLAL
ncbi:polymer-forming cytoskeletal protein [Microbacterium sp. NPDC087665]|uniref:bactofilin family protein n=1 Tax=Microbacterium sp. NPDC087665 TaxID=3364194 RepID=UPI00380AC3F9